MIRHGSLFSGYGGLELGVQAALGGTVAWHSEVDPGACKILAHRWPDVPNIGDITAADWSTVEPVDVLTGGFPCQDVSHAGKRAGLHGHTRTGLWSHMATAIETLRPLLVVAENVRGLLSAGATSDLEPCPWCVGDDVRGALRALGAVLGTLADLGYDARWTGLRAADVGSPHGRFRVFIVAHPVGTRLERTGVAGNAAASTRQPTGPNGGGRIAAGQCAAAAVAWGKYGPAIARWEHVLGRPAPAPTEPGRTGQPRLAPVFVEWLMGLPAGWVTGVPGLSRNDQLKALGNGVVPQQAEAAVRVMLGSVLPLPSPYPFG